MPIVNNTNFPNKVPTAVDYATWIKDSDESGWTATMLQYANLFASLASQNLTVTVVDSEITLSTEQVVAANSGSAFNINLPANSLNTGRPFRIFNKNSGTVTIVPAGSDTINANASLALAQYESVYLIADGLGMWQVYGA